MSQVKPTDSEIDIYAQEYIRHGDQTKSWIATFPKSKAKPETSHENASRFHKIIKVIARIKELRVKTTEIAEKKFTITVEQRLKWLKDIIEAGLDDYIDASGGKRKENLPAARSAIDTLNNMLGADEENGTVKPVKVFVGVADAS